MKPLFFKYYTIYLTIAGIMIIILMLLLIICMKSQCNGNRQHHSKWFIFTQDIPILLCGLHIFFMVGFSILHLGPFWIDTINGLCEILELLANLIYGVSKSGLYIAFTSRLQIFFLKTPHLDTVLEKLLDHYIL